MKRISLCLLLFVCLSNGVLLAQTLVLQEAIDLALKGSPELARYEAESRAAAGRRDQSTLPPNPELSVLVEDAAGSGSYTGLDSAQASLELSQMMETGGKRAHRGAIGDAGMVIAGARYRAAQADVRADVRTAFVDVLSLQERLTLADEGRKIADTALATVRLRVNAGKGSPLEEKQAIIAKARAGLDHEHVEHELAAAWLALAATWGSNTVGYSRATGDIYAITNTATLTLNANSLDGNPELDRLASERSLREAEVGLAHARRMPDITLSIGARQYESTDDSAFLAGVSLPLPLFNRYKGDRIEADALAEGAIRASEATAVNLHARLFALVEEARHVAKAVNVIGDSLLPEAQEAIAIAESGYQQGRFSRLEWLEAHKTYMDLKLERLAAATTYHHIDCEIERLTGHPTTAEGK